VPSSNGNASAWISLHCRDVVLEGTVVVKDGSRLRGVLGHRLIPQWLVVVAFTRNVLAS
jgi:hypothetical protein